MTQINSFNGGAAVPGNALAKDDIKLLSLLHYPPTSSAAQTEVYSPLNGATIRSHNLRIFSGDKLLAEYDPLAGMSSVDVATPLKDGDNIHIDENSKINVVNRKTLAVESPLTIAKTSTQLILGIRPDAFATADDIASEAEARKEADDTLESSIAGKQDGKFTFDSNSSSHSDVMAAIVSGRAIVSGSGSSLATWQGSIIGGVANLFRVYETDVYHYYYSFGQWAFQRYSLATTMDYSKVAYPTSTQVPGDILFAMGGFNVCGYMDNAASLRLCVVPTDGKDHSIYANGGGYRCYAETGSSVSTSFTTTSTYLRLYIVDMGYWDSAASELTPTNWTVHEAEIYALPSSSVADSAILYRVITDQTIGGSNG